MASLLVLGGLALAANAVLLSESGVFKSTRQAYSIRVVQWSTFTDAKIRKLDQIAASFSKVVDWGGRA